MSLGNGELAHARQAVHLAGIFIAEQRRGFAHAVGKVAVALSAGFVNIVLERAGHRTKRIDIVVGVVLDHCDVLDPVEILVRLGRVELLLVIITEDEHAVLVVVPVVGNLVEGGLGHVRRAGADIAPLVILEIFNPTLQPLYDLRAAGHEQRETLSDDIDCREDIHLPAEAVVVPLLDVLEMLKVRFQVFLFRVGRAVDASEHLIVLIASPVRSGGGDELVRLDGLRAHEVRAGAEIHKISLTVEGNLLAFGKVFDELDLVGLISLLHQGDGLVAGQRELLQTVALLDDFLHLRFDLVQVFTVEGSRLEVIVEAVFDRRTDGKLYVRIKMLYSFSQYM